MDAVGYFEAKAKMTDNCMIGCYQCPLGRENNAHDCACNFFEVRYPKEAVALVEKWRNENMYRVPKDTPIDAKVMCSDDDDSWFPRHFAGFENGKMMAWRGGCTSHTITEKTPWKLMKLVE